MPFRNSTSAPRSEDADTGGTTAGSVVITTKRGTNEWHGDAALLRTRIRAKRPLPHRESGAAEPKAAFLAPELCRYYRRSDREEQGLAVRLLRKRARKCQHRLQSRQHRPVRRSGAVGSMGLIPAYSFVIPVPANVPIPFRDYLGSMRFDWAQSPKSKWFLRYVSKTATTTQQFWCSRRRCRPPG